MKRRLFTILATLSLLLFAAVVVMWLRSYDVSTASRGRQAGDARGRRFRGRGNSSCPAILRHRATYRGTGDPIPPARTRLHWSPPRAAFVSAPRLVTTIAAVKLEDLADEQIERLHRQVSRRVNYLWRMIHRMTDVAFDREVYDLAVTAHDALRSMATLLHEAMLERRGETPLRKPDVRPK